jgi:hypothetical protein
MYRSVTEHFWLKSITKRKVRTLFVFTFTSNKQRNWQATWISLPLAAINEFQIKLYDFSQKWFLVQGIALLA